MAENGVDQRENLPIPDTYSLVKSEVDLLLDPRYIDRLSERPLLFPFVVSEVLLPRVAQLSQLSPGAVRDSVGPHLASRDPTLEIITDGITALPQLRLDKLTISNRILHYYGRDIEVDGLGDGEYEDCYELAVGYIVVMDKDGNPIGVIDAHPNTRMIAGSGSVVKQKLTPPEDLFQRMFGRRTSASRDEITTFLRDCPTFFAADGEFMERAGLGQEISFSVFPPESKFLMHQLFQKGLSDSEKEQVYKFFHLHGVRGGFMLAAMTDRMDAVLPFIRVANLTSKEVLESYLGNEFNWMVNKPGLSVDEITMAMTTYAKEADPQELGGFSPEILAWTVQVEGFSFNMAMTVLPEKMRTADNARIILDLTHAIQRRTRTMVAEYVKFVDSHVNLVGANDQEYRQFVEKNSREMEYFVHGIRAQILLVSILGHQGFTGLATALKLPPYFFQNYREVAGRLGSAHELSDSLLELWEAVYIEKQRGSDSEAKFIEDTKKFWAQHREVRSEGAQTGETETEIERDKQALIGLYKMEGNQLPWRMKLMRLVNTIDCGSGSGWRRLLPLLRIYRKVFHADPHWTVGVDISDVEDRMPDMDFRQQTYIEAAQDPDLVGQFDFVKSDWSASNDATLLRVQMLNAVAYNRLLREASSVPTGEAAGYLLLDTAFPEGEGSYDAVIRAFKELNVDVPEGVFPFNYQGAGGDPKTFMLYYYEMLYKFFEDAGFEICNLPKEPQERQEFLKSILDGSQNLEENKTDPWKSPVYKIKGKPRVTIIAKKVREAVETENIRLRTLLLDLLGPRAIADVIKKKLQDAAQGDSKVLILDNQA